MRFAQTKQQLADAENRLRIEHGPRLTFTIREPVLLEQDILFLTRRKPSRNLKTEDGLFWTYYFIKQARPGQGSQRAYDVAVGLFFKEGTLCRFGLPGRFSQGLDKGFVLQSVKGLGRASVVLDPKGLSGRVPFESMEMQGNRPPSMEDIEALLGQPFEEERRGDEILLKYLYVLETAPDSRDKEPPRQRASLKFRSADKRLISLDVRFSGRTLLLNYPPESTFDPNKVNNPPG